MTDCKIPNVPGLLKFKKQFIDIVDNHAAFVAEKLDDIHTHAAAAELRKEYFADRTDNPTNSPTAAAQSML